MPNGSLHWVWTLNNPTDEHELLLTGLVPAVCSYSIFGREVGESGTRHLQGYSCFLSRKTLVQVKNIFPDGVHFEAKRGTVAQASEYCKKDGDYEEAGTLPVEQGHRSDIDKFKEWLSTLDSAPSEYLIATTYSNLWIRYPRSCMQLAAFICPPVQLEVRAPRAWQEELLQAITEEAPDREVLFYVDLEGGVGKSWLMKKMLTVYPRNVQILGGGKAVDIAHAIDEFRTVFVFDIPRGGMEFLHYGILEKLKDRVVFSPKYSSRVKILRATPHVIVFCNEMPDMNKMSIDRYVIINEFRETLANVIE